MKKEKVLEFLESKKIDYLKLGTAIFEKKDKLLCLTFLYAENNKELIDREKEKINKLIEEYVNLKDIKINIKYQKAFLDEDRTKLIIKEFLKKFYVASYYALKEINVIKNENNLKINISFALNDEEIANIKIKILEMLTSKFFYNFNIEVAKVEINFDGLSEHKNEVLDNITMPLLVKKMKVKNLKNIIGEVNENSCYPYEFYLNPEENIYLCGHLESIEKVEFLKKNDNTPSIRYAMKIKCLDKTFNASLFPSKKNLAIADSIESGIDVIMQGNLDLFGRELSFKVKTLAQCEIDEYIRPQKEINKIYPRYKIVSPMKYEEISQANLFDTRSECDYLKNNEFVVFDLETTGFDYLTCKITEIGAVKIRDGKIVETFSTFINPQMKLPQEIIQLTHITDEMVKNAPLFEEVIPDFFKFCQNAIMVGHHVSFDFGFLDYYSNNANYVFYQERLDTEAIAKKNIFLKSYKLHKVAEALNVSLVNAHRAINDALATAKVFIKLVEKFY